MRKEAGKPAGKKHWGRWLVSTVAMAGAVACLAYAQKPAPLPLPPQPAPKGYAPLGGATTARPTRSDGYWIQPPAATPRKSAVDPNAVNVPRIMTTIRSGQISDALRQITEAGPRLGRTQRTELLVQAMNVLAQNLQAPKDLNAALKLVADVRPYAQALKEDCVNRVVTALDAWLAWQGLVRDLQTINDYLAKGQWGQAALRAQSRAGQANLPAEMKTTLGDVVRISRQFQALEQIQNALQTAERNRPGETVETVRDFEVEPVSPPLGKLVREFRALTEIWAVAEDRGRRPPKVAHVKQSLAALQTSAGDAALTAQLQLDLAAKWFLDGFPHEAREILPASSGSADQAGGLLADIQTLVQGKGGEVHTWPARHAVQGSTGSTKAVRTPPPGVGRLLPADRRDAWRSPAPDPDRGALSSLDEVIRREKPLRDKLQAAYQDERETVQLRAEQVQDQMKTLSQGEARQQEDLQQVYAEVESYLERADRLSAAERVLAWYGYRRGLKTPVIADGLRNYPTGR